MLKRQRLLEAEKDAHRFQPLVHAGSCTEWAKLPSARGEEEEQARLPAPAPGLPRPPDPQNPPPLAGALELGSSAP